MIVTKGVFTDGELPPVHRCSQIPLRGFVVKNQEAFLTDFFFTSGFRITKLRDLIWIRACSNTTPIRSISWQTPRGVARKIPQGRLFPPPRISRLR